LCYYLFLEVFSNTADTGLPALIEHVHKTTEVRRRHSMEHLIRSVTHFVLDVASYEQVGSHPFLVLLTMSDKFEIEC